MSIAVSGMSSLRFYLEVPQSVTKMRELVDCLRKSEQVTHFPVQQMRHNNDVIVTCGQALEGLRHQLAVFW